MRTRTPVTAVFFLIAAITCVQVAAAAPAPPSPPVRAHPSAITERAALVIEPGQLGRLPLPLDTGDRVDGRVTVVPQDVNFTVEGPDGRIIVNAGRITAKDFSFVAYTRGIYQLIFANTLFLISNKVVLLEFQHTGAQALPSFAGNYIAVPPGETRTFAVALTANQALRGALEIRGGQQEIGFSIRDLNGSTVVSEGKVYSSHSFTFAPIASGSYQICFDNTFSTYISKLVSFELYTSPGGQLQWWGTPPQLAFTTSPGGAITGSTFTTQPVVTVQDASGNTATTSSAVVNLAITAGTGASGAVLSGTTTVTAQNGVARFSGLGIDLPGAGYTLTATAIGVTSARSSAFNVTLPPNYITLNAGWNLISLPLVPANTAITSVLSSVMSSVISVWHYDAASTGWANFVPGMGGTLTTMKDGKAYWINMSAPAIFKASGSELPPPPAPRPAYPVATGWNMIGFKSMAPRSLAGYLTGTNYRTFPIYGYASSAYSIVSADTGSLQPGMGYWVYFNTTGAIRP